MKAAEELKVKRKEEWELAEKAEKKKKTDVIKTAKSKGKGQKRKASDSV